jgi:Flavin-binding monooxygenase-like
VLPYDHFERHSALGGVWDITRPDTPMYESAHLISSKTQSAFAGFPMPDDYPDYPSHRQILAYLQSYARHTGVDQGIRFSTTVNSVTPDERGVEVVVDSEARRYRAVVCASGVNWEPLLPELPGEFSGELRHTSTYKSPSELSGKRVLIVGLGNSGADIACDAARSARLTRVSVRRGYHFVPKHVFGMPTDVFAHEGPQLPLWLERPLFAFLLRLVLGDMQKLGMPKPDHAVLESQPLMNDQLVHYLRHGDVALVGDVRAFDGREVVFADGSRQEFDLVLFATGYTRRIPYVDAQFLDGGTWAAGQFLTCMSRRYPSLFTLGFAELNGAIYPHLNRMAALIAELLLLERTDPPRVKAFRRWQQHAKLDLTGGRHLISSYRHDHYCDDHALKSALDLAFAKLGTRAEKLLASPPLALPEPRP